MCKVVNRTNIALQRNYDEKLVFICLYFRSILLELFNNINKNFKDKDKNLKLKFSLIIITVTL